METLTDTTRIIGLFSRLLERRALLTIKIEDDPQEFTTAVINVLPDKGTIILDELKPNHGHLLLKNSPTFKAETQLDGVTISFTATVVEFGKQDAIDYYSIQIPAQLNYNQRRQSVRISLNSAIQFPVTLTTAEGLTVTGDLADLSIGGLRVRFEENLPPSIEDGQHLDCSFLLPTDNKEKFSCDVIVRVIRHRHEGHKHPSLGGQFFDITKSQERQISGAVMLLQRIAQQKRNG